MAKTKQLAEIFEQKFSEQEHIRGQFSRDLGDPITRFEFHVDKIKMQDSGLRIFKEDITGSVAFWNIHNWDDPIAVWGPGDGLTTKEQIGPSGLII